ASLACDPLVKGPVVFPEPTAVSREGTFVLVASPAVELEPVAGGIEKPPPASPAWVVPLLPDDSSPLEAKSGRSLAHAITPKYNKLANQRRSIAQHCHALDVAYNYCFKSVT